MDINSETLLIERLKSFLSLLNRRVLIELRGFSVSINLELNFVRSSSPLEMSLRVKFELIFLNILDEVFRNSLLEVNDRKCSDP